MPRYGYACVTTTDQDLAVQREALERGGCIVIRSETVGGTSRQGREELRTLVSFFRPDDELVGTRVDRCALHPRSAGHRTQAARKKVALVATAPPIDTSTAAGRAFPDMPDCSHDIHIPILEYGV